jgi:hypothetical protein
VFLARPTPAHNIESREDLIRRAGDVLTWVREGRLDVSSAPGSPLTEVATAHRMAGKADRPAEVLLSPCPRHCAPTRRPVPGPQLPPYLTRRSRLRVPAPATLLVPGRVKPGGTDRDTSTVAEQAMGDQ